YALEESYDTVTGRAAKADIFTQRVIVPDPPLLGADTAAEALAICLNTYAEGRLDEIARRSGVHPAAPGRGGPAPGAGPRGARHPGLRRPRHRHAGLGAAVPVRKRPREAPRRRGRRRDGPPVRPERHRAAR